MEALIVVDVQNDFCPGGTLAVPHGDEVVPIINALMDEYAVVVSTQDWHPANHISFVEQGGPWPPHCVAGTPGSELHPKLQQGKITIRIRKGDKARMEAYSGFQGTNLAEVLEAQGVSSVVVVGLATDYCVKATVLDALKAGFGVTVIPEACRAVDVNPGDGDAALEAMRKAGAVIR